MVIKGSNMHSQLIMFHPSVFSTVDCGRHMVEPSGVITSPNYPAAYPNDADCTWTIQVSTGPITLTFSFAEFEGCTIIYDALYVRIFETNIKFGLHVLHVPLDVIFH